MPTKLIPMKAGDTKELGEKEFALTGEGGLTMQVAVIFSKTYNLGGLMASRAKLVDQLAEVDSLIAKHAELVEAKP